MEKGRLVIAFIVALAVFSLFSLNSQTAYAGSVGLAFVSIDDVSLEEGDDGTTDFVFTVSAVCEGPCDTFSIGYSTTPDTATEADDDYNGVPDGLVTLFPGGVNDASGTITIQVNGDTDFESDETFFVNIFDCGFCTFTDNQGVGTIENDDVVSSPDDVFVVMGACCDDDPQDGSLASADLDTGILTQIGDAVAPQVEMNGLSGLAINSIGRLFVTAVEGDCFDCPSRLLELDRNTGEIINNVGLTMFNDGDFVDVKLRDLSFRPGGTNILFGVGQVMDGTNNGLFTVDTSSAEVDLIDIIDASTVLGLAFAPDGTLYGITRGEGCELIIINPEDPTDIAFVTSLNRCYDGLGIDSAGQIFGTTAGSGSLHLIDTDDGSDATVAGEGTSPSDVDFLRTSEPGTIYGSAGNVGTDPGSIFLVSETDGSQTFIGDPTTSGGVSGLSFTSDGRLWGTNVFPGAGSDLIQIDPDTGDLIDNVGPIQLPDNEDIKVADLATQPGTDVLFGLTDFSNLVTIDKTNGAATLITTYDDVGAIGFAPDGTFYMVDRNDEGSLFTVNPSDGSILSMVTRSPSGEIDALGVSPAGVIYVAGTTFEGAGPDIFTLGTDGTMSFIGSGLREVADLAFAPEPIEPEGDDAYVSGSTSSSSNLENGAIGIANFDSGVITQIGNQIVNTGGLSGLTFDSNGNLFGSSVTGFFSSSELYQIDPSTGDVIFSDSIILTDGGSLKIRDLATQPDTDVMFGIGNVIEGENLGCDSFNSLFTIDSSDASADCIGTLEIEGVSEAQFGGLAFAPDGTLFATGDGWICDDEEFCDTVNFLANFNPDASFAGFFLEVDNFFDGLGIRPSDGGFFGTVGEEVSIHGINLDTGETFTVAGENDNPSDITFFPFDASLAPSGTGGQGYEGPTLGEFDDGRLIVSDGFCFDRFCLDVLDYFNHLPIQQVDSGTTHTISMTAYCSAGSNRCNYASVGAAPPGTDINSVDWNVILKRTGTSNDWQVTKVDPNGMLGDVTGTVQIVDASRIQYTFNIQFITPASIGTVDGNAEPPEDNMILVTEIRDSNGGAGRNIFNEGVFVNDIYAYPQVDASYLPSVKVAPLCLNEDPSDRNTCAFEQVRQWTLKQAEEKLKEIYEQNNYKTD